MSKEHLPFGRGGDYQHRIDQHRAALRQPPQPTGDVGQRLRDLANGYGQSLLGDILRDLATDADRINSRSPLPAWQPIATWEPKAVNEHWPYLHAIVFSDGVVMEADWKPGETPPETGEWWPANTDSEYASQIFPTHWMPIPAPPAGEEGE